MKTITIVLLASVLTMSMYMPILASESKFSDVQPDDWFFEYVEFVRSNNIMQGTDANTFSPNATLTRAHVAAALFRMHFDRTANASDTRESGFSDVEENAWFAPYVAWASVNDIVHGVDNNHFAPRDNVTRQQFATMLYRYANILTNLSTSVNQSEQLHNFDDRNQVAPWAISGLTWANYQGIITGKTAKAIEPTSTASRAEAAAMLTRFAQLIKQEEINADDFELTISVAETTLPQGENFIVYVELKNNSGEDIEIVYSRGFRYSIPGRRTFGPTVMNYDPPEPRLRLLKAEEVMHGRMLVLSNILELGTHELSGSFSFSLVSGNSRQHISLVSNTVILTVTKGAFELYISVEEATLPQGENFRIHAELRNNSGEDHEITITSSGIFNPFIADWSVFAEKGSNWIPDQTRLFEAGSIIRNIEFLEKEEDVWIFGYTLKPGTHELIGQSYFRINGQGKIIISNSILLTVQ